jgi:hypothetical protein
MYGWEAWPCGRRPPLRFDAPTSPGAGRPPRLVSVSNSDRGVRNCQGKGTDNVFRSKLLAVATAGFGVALCMTTTIGQAQVEGGPISDVVALEGTAAIGPTTAGCPGTYVCGTGGSGQYGFASNACLGVSDGPEVAANCVVASQGTFNNTVCGTGNASGTATITEPTSVDPPGDTYDVTYVINFVAGVGLLTGNQTNAVPASDNDWFAGVVLLGLEPGTQGDPTQNQCVNGFAIVNADVAFDLGMPGPVVPPLA